MSAIHDVAHRLRWLRIAITTVLLLVVHPAASAAGQPAFERPWFEYRSANFVVRSDVDEAVIAQRIAELELFRAVVLKVTGSPPGRVETPVTLYWFGNVGEFQRSVGRAAIIGYMAPSLRGHQIVLRDTPAGGLDGRHTAFHEYVHYLLRNHDRGSTQPKWYDEGLAEFLAATRIAGDRVVLGGDIPERIASLRSPVQVSIEEMLTTPDVSDWPAARLSVYYGKAYALVNYLHLARLAGGPDRLAQLRTYLNAVNAGQAPAPAFEAAFGTTFAAMNRELGQFLSRSQRPVLALPVTLFAHDPRYTRHAIPDETLAYDMGYVHVARDPAFARSLFSAHTSGAAAARFLAGIAVSHQMQDDFAGGLPHLRAALAAGPNDPIVLQEAADFFAVLCRRPQAPADCAATRAESRALYARLLEVAPDSLEAHETFGALLIDLEDYATAIPLLERVVRDAPWSVGSVARLGLARHRNGDPRAALPLLKRALAWAEPGSTLGDALQEALAEAEAATRSAAGG